MTKQKKRDNIAKGILQFIGGRGYLPLKGEELQEALDIPDQLTSLFEEALETLLDQEAIRKSGGRFVLAESRIDVTQGILKLHPRGFGFLLPDNRTLCPTDIFIPRPHIGGAVDGDRVEVTIEPSPRSKKGPEGRVIRIVERARDRVSGIMIGREEMLAPLLGPDQTVKITSKKKLKRGDRVVVTIDEWEPLSGRVTEVIGSIDDPSFDIKAALEQFEIRGDFPKEVVEEAKQHGTRVGKQAMEGRVDLRGEVAITVDPKSAKDFDDALSLHQDRKGHYHLTVHIADVSAYVLPGSMLDQEARRRCNSTYFPGECVPMLPKDLSDNLCSLKPEVNRLAVSIEMEINKKGELVDYSIVRTVIRSRRRFSYEEAKEILDGKKSPYAKLLKQMEALCLLLKKQRKLRGTVEFALPEVVIEVDETGEPKGTRTVEYDITHQMVEEFMLKANEVVATDLAKKGRGFTYRIHQEPDEESLKDFAAMAGVFGFELSASPSAEELQALFEAAKESPHGHLLAVGYIRSMKLATYSPDNIGHYGLSLKHYCHFTSPIRRYADLVVHRALLSPDEAIDEGELAQVALECSEQERVSARAEQSVSLLKKLRLLNKSDPKREWKAVITKVQPFGLFFELADLMLEGLIHISQIGADYYVFDELSGELYGERMGEKYRIGQTIGVLVDSIDFVRGEVEWRHIAKRKGRKKRC